MTASVLAAFAISVPFESLSHLLSRAIYATRHTIMQVLGSLAGLAITVATTLLLADGAGIIAIPLGFAVGQAGKTVLLALALWIRVRSLSAGPASGS
jgi:peptidoglycan biosynthesis protein MviN/MurJ (putative lipid II flippase)